MPRAYALAMTMFLYIFMFVIARNGSDEAIRNIFYKILKHRLFFVKYAYVELNCKFMYNESVRSYKENKEVNL